MSVLIKLLCIAQKGRIGTGSEGAPASEAIICDWIFMRILDCSLKISNIIGIMNMKPTAHT